MIRPIDITNAGNIVFAIGMITVVQVFVKPPAWLSLLIVFALLMQIGGTMAYFLDLPTRLQKKIPKTLQGVCDQEGVRYFPGKKHGWHGWNAEVFSSLISQFDIPNLQTSRGGETTRR